MYYGCVKYYHWESWVKNTRELCKLCLQLLVSLKLFKNRKYYVYINSDVKQELLTGNWGWPTGNGLSVLLQVSWAVGQETCRGWERGSPAPVATQTHSAVHRQPQSERDWQSCSSVRQTDCSDTAVSSSHLVPALKSQRVHFFLTLQSVISDWWLETSYGGSLYSIEIRVFPLDSWLWNVYQHTTTPIYIICPH